MSHNLKDAMKNLGIDEAKLREKLSNLPGVASDNSGSLEKFKESVESSSFHGDTSEIIYFIEKTIDNFTAIAATIAILFIVINAFRLTISGLASEELGKAKKGLTWSALGLLLVIFSYVVVRTVILISFSGETN